eukprot:TRINITY_DN22070_c0_g1_i1.p1 TRINITY_DN22070_c0_g1~~TRINITY_DN22070_c0_g1_i1.p1  ORF type:complete len:641 (+),score=161.23 TRINITY_DN22070_c0_g1_i1:94-2016(+)
MVPILCFAFLQVFLADSHKILGQKQSTEDAVEDVTSGIAAQNVVSEAWASLGIELIQEKPAGHGHHTEAAGHGHDHEAAGHGHHDEKAEHGHNDEKAGHGHHDEKAGHGHHDEKAGHGHHDEKAGHGHHKEGHGHEEHGHEGGHGHHAPDTTTTVASYMLIGGITIVMALFYLVQHPDLDIRFYSWNILTLSMCIFISVLITDMVNMSLRQWLFEKLDTGNVNYVWMCMALSVCWFVASQAVCAWLSGAFGEEAKEPKDAETEEERKQLESLWEEREVALKCWGGLVAHCAGFSIIATLAAVQDTPFFSSSPAMSMCVVPLSMLFVTVFYKLAAFVRRQISLMDDGEVSKGEDLWDDCSAQAENEALCLGLSFACMRSIFFFTFGEMPDGHGHVHGHVSDETWQFGWKVLWAISMACIAAGLGTAMLKDKVYGGHGHGHEEHGAGAESGEHGEHGEHNEQVAKVEHAEKTKHGEEAEKCAEEGDEDERLGPRLLNILSETFIMAFAWGMLFCATACLNANLVDFRFHLAGHLLVALGLSAASCLVVLCLDKVADVLKKGADSATTVHIIGHIIEANGLLIGIGWEICFAMSMHAIGFDLNGMGKNVTLGLMAFLSLVVVPAYRLYMLPELNTRMAKVGHH